MLMNNLVCNILILRDPTRESLSAIDYYVLPEPRYPKTPGRILPAKEHTGLHFFTPRPGTSVLQGPMRSGILSYEETPVSLSLSLGL
jgi:hypothetical protein